MKETKPEITLTPEQTIEKLLDNFDFQKVHKVMDGLIGILVIFQTLKELKNVQNNHYCKLCTFLIEQ